MTRVSVWWCTLCAAVIPDEPLYAPPRFELPYHLLGEAKHSIRRVNMATTDDVLGALRVDRKLLNDWVRRGLVNPPVRIGREHWYDLDQAQDAEYMGRMNTRRGHRRVST